MSSRIDDLEKNIADLMTQAGVEELEGENKIPATQKSWRWGKGQCKYGVCRYNFDVVIFPAFVN